MLGTGLTLPRPESAGDGGPDAPVSRGTFNLGGVLPVKPLSTVLAEEAQAAARAADALASQPVISELVALLQRHWTLAKQAKGPIERDMLRALRAKQGQYDPDKLSAIREQGGSEIYMMLFATKARQAKALIADILLGTGTDKPWSVRATPKPDIPPQELSRIMQGVTEMVAQIEASGVPLSIDEVRQMLVDARTQVEHNIREYARQQAEAAETKIEDLLQEGQFIAALDQFLDDLMVFKTAFLKGPVVRQQPALAWVQQPDGRHMPQVEVKPRPAWERVDPFMIYPAPWARNVNDAFLFERHRLTRRALTEMIGVPGYSEEAIRAVLDAHGSGGLRNWLSIDTERAEVEGRDVGSAVQDDLIDALQYWGSVSGKMLLDWGLSAEEVEDPAREYEVELWLIGNWVIKATLNAHPLGRRPYYCDSYERVPGAFWGNSQYDLMADCQDMCNAAARALANNMGISSGPQVWVNRDRVAPGEEVTQMFPWKIWQTTADPMGSTAAPVGFFQPNSNAMELMQVFERFSVLADEVTGIPRYMAGLGGGAGGAGRTASGMSMMIGNASKIIKNLVMSLDLYVIGPVVESAYSFLLQYVGDPELRGDLNIVARGAISLAAREAAQLRRNEFLQATANPIDLQIMGPEGRAELLRDAARMLDMNPDKIVPSATKMRLAQLQQQMQLAMQQQMQQMQLANQTSRAGKGQQLMNEAPVTDIFEPRAT